MSEPELPIPLNTALEQPEWVLRTMQQLKKDADLSGIEWADEIPPVGYEAWMDYLTQKLQQMDRQNPEYLNRFLYRVDLPEKQYLQSPAINHELSLAVLKREFMKVWFKHHYKP